VRRMRAALNGRIPPSSPCAHPNRSQVGAVSTPTANVAQRLENAPEDQKMDLLVALISAEVRPFLLADDVPIVLLCDDLH
jgi:hypothetical protein